MKSTDRILAGRYARAFDALSHTPQQAAQRLEDLRGAAHALRAAAKYMNDPAVPTADKKAFAAAVFAQNKTISAFVMALLEAKRYYLLDACVEEAAKLADEHLGIVRADVETAFELGAEQKKRVEESLSRFTGKKAVASFSVDESLLGGLRAKTGDVLIDGSLKRQFERLQEELTK